MPRGIKKENLPSKICVVCDRPFTWRKKWEKVWEEVTTCSKSCNRKRRQQNRQQNNRQQFSTCSAAACNDDYIDTVSEVATLNDKTIENPAFPTNDDTSIMNEMKCIRDNPSDELHELLQQVDLNSDNNTNTEKDELSDNSDMVVSTEENEEELDPVALRKKARKEAKKRKKQERRAQREGRGDKSAGQKECDVCGASVDLLIRCTIDESLDFKMVCGKCWPKVSGGVVDGDSNHPHYKYGGLWKNRRRR